MAGEMKCVLKMAALPLSVFAEEPSAADRRLRESKMAARLHIITLFPSRKFGLKEQSPPLGQS